MMRLRSKSRLTIGDFVAQLNPEVSELMKAAREMMMKLGSDVAEDVRVHRVVYGRGDVLRAFAELRPTAEGVKVSYRAKSLVAGPLPSSWRILTLGALDQLDTVQPLLHQAYSSV